MLIKKLIETGLLTSAQVKAAAEELQLSPLSSLFEQSEAPDLDDDIPF